MRKLESGRLTVTDVQALKTPQQMSNSTRVFMMILPMVRFFVGAPLSAFAQYGAATQPEKFQKDKPLQSLMLFSLLHPPLSAAAARRSCWRQHVSQHSSPGDIAE